MLLKLGRTTDEILTLMNPLSPIPELPEKWTSINTMPDFHSSCLLIPRAVTCSSFVWSPWIWESYGQTESNHILSMACYQEIQKWLTSISILFLGNTYMFCRLWSWSLILRKLNVPNYNVHFWFFCGFQSND